MNSLKTRTIKFRAFVKNEPNKGMYYPKVIQLAEGKFDRLWTDNYKLSSDVDDVVLMQYTGLNDKNGVEIYEGDIVKNNRYGGLSKIIWKQGEGSTAGEVKGLFGEMENINGFISELGGFYFEGIGQNTKAHFVGEFEVIGNIYENPELLTPSDHELTR